MPAGSSGTVGCICIDACHGANYACHPGVVWSSSRNDILFRGGWFHTGKLDVGGWEASMPASVRCARI